MPIQFQCTGCSHQLQVPDEAVGGKAKCPVCGCVMVVPVAAEFSEAVSAEEVPSHEGDAPQAGQSGTGSPFGAAGGPPQGAIPAFDPYGRRPDSPFMPPISPRRFSIGEAWGDTWAVYTRRFGLVLGITLLAVAINFGASMFDGMIRGVAVSFLGEIGFLVGIVTVIINQVFQIWINIGLFLFLLNMVADRNPSINDLFSGGRYLLRYIGAVILFLCGWAAIFLLFALPVIGLFIAGGNQLGQQGFNNASQMFWVIGGAIAGVGVFCLTFYSLTFTLWPLLLIDRNICVTEAFGASAKLMPGNRLKYFFIQAVTGIGFAAFGLLTCGIGFIFAIPFLHLLGVILYYHIAGLPVGRMYQEI